MKGYVGTLLNLPESVKMAERCIATGKQFNVDVEVFPAVWKDIAFEEIAKENLTLQKYDESYSNVGAVVGNFITQFRTWKLIAAGDEPGIILEHDAVFVMSLPELTEKGDIINLGKPSYGKFKSMNFPGIYPMFSKQGGLYAPGAHGYYVTPKGATQLINIARAKGAAPCDLFLSNKFFPNIMEAYPWPIEAHDEFTTIQLERGCIAKHNYKKGKYKIL